MNKMDAENLFASLFHRWKTGDLSTFERDYPEDIEVVFDDDVLNYDDLKERSIYFHENFEILESSFEDFLFDHGQMAVRKKMKLKNRKDHEVRDETFCWFFELKNNQVCKYWLITNFPFGFKPPSNSINTIGGPDGKK